MDGRYLWANINNQERVIASAIINGNPNAIAAWLRVCGLQVAAVHSGTPDAHATHMTIW